jgi:hypothetical protein
MIGREFLVVYRSDDPSDSDLNTDHPIASREEFDTLVSRFKTEKVKPDWPDCK